VAFRSSFGFRFDIAYQDFNRFYFEDSRIASIIEMRNSVDRYVKIDIALNSNSCTYYVFDFMAIT
jgi:hypothetical protein